MNNNEIKHLIEILKIIINNIKNDKILCINTNTDFEFMYNPIMLNNPVNA
jgi:hypothetical protein